MEKRTELERVSEETMVFLRGSYLMDEIGDGKEELKFRRGGKTLVTIYIREDRYDFLVIYGRKEREQFESRRGDFPAWVQEIYETSKTFHDGKWMMIPVRTLEELEPVKEMIRIKRKPNRKPFPKEQAQYSRCGMRCDLCIHFTGETMSEVFRQELRPRLARIYGEESYGEDLMRCDGCRGKGMEDDCASIRCLREKGLEGCGDCDGYIVCSMVPAVHCRIESKSISADDVTWAVLPYVREQYGN